MSEVRSTAGCLSEQGHPFIWMIFEPRMYRLVIPVHTVFDKMFFFY